MLLDLNVSGRLSSDNQYLYNLCRREFASIAQQELNKWYQITLCNVAAGHEQG